MRDGKRGLGERKIVRHLKAPPLSEADPRSMAPRQCPVPIAVTAPAKPTAAAARLRTLPGLIVEDPEPDQESNPGRVGHAQRLLPFSRTRVVSRSRFLRQTPHPSQPVEMTQPLAATASCRTLSRSAVGAAQFLVRNLDHRRWVHMSARRDPRYLGCHFGPVQKFPGIALCARPGSEPLRL